MEVVISMKRRAILSVSDKTGIVEFGEKLASLGFEVISTGGWQRCWKCHIKVTSIVI